MKKSLIFSLLLALNMEANASNNDTTAASMIIHQFVDMMSNVMITANQMSQKQGNKQKFDTQQINCMANTNNEYAVTTMQSFLEKNFTMSELQEINRFYASTAGKKQADMNKNIIALLAKKDVESIKSTAEEEKQITAFWKSSTGRKLGIMLKDKSQPHPVMNQIIDKKLVDCHLLKGIS